MNLNAQINNKNNNNNNNNNNNCLMHKNARIT